MGTSAPPPALSDQSSALDSLSPVPVSARIDAGSALRIGAVQEASHRGHPAWSALADLDPDGLRSEGYALRIRAAGNGGEALLAAADEEGLFRARTTLAALRAASATLPPLSIRDEPALPWRGTIEGFYGEPWSHADRLEHLRFCARNKLNSFAYAPKDDPYHRERWREPYPDVDLARLAELVRAAEESRVRFTYTIAPGLSMVYSSPVERDLLFAKAEQLWSIGVRSFALLFDDIPAELQHQEDREVFGGGDGASGAAHGRVCAEFQDRFLAPRGGDRLVMVPTEYAGLEQSPYRSRLAETLPADALVWWTGSDVVVGSITREEVDAAAAAFDRDLLLWDNFPVNDFDAARLFLGPLLGRPKDLEGSRLVGVSANPMIQASASQFALATVADWAWNPSAYDPEQSAARAVRAVAGSLASALRPLLAVTSAWPPSLDRAPHLSAAIPAALEGDHAALTRLEEALAELAALPAAVEDQHGPLLDELRPWLEAAGREAAIALAATELLAEGRPVGGERRARLLADLDAVAGAPHDVLRATLVEYARSVLARLA
ncbi:protein O-GlcNAcase [Naasia sp. SYSU D00948]|uniref:protein O-GlcNAcase n=1 Tax=Naasia sp. SYSU D00948 TaxID=2817379 RepID=UPI001B30C7F0|nr:beta-N-acetylglucosaminidase domain-containing protein [Naasia sp. SYSU D00948]